MLLSAAFPHFGIICLLCSFRKFTIRSQGMKTPVVHSPGPVHEPFCCRNSHLCRLGCGLLASWMLVLLVWDT